MNHKQEQPPTTANPMKASLWKRLNTSQLIFIALLILGVIVAVWMEKASSAATQRSDKLTSATERIRYELLASDYALRGQLLETKPELDKNFITESRQNFTNTLAHLRTHYGHDKTLATILEKARHYADTTTPEFQTRVLNLQKTNPTAAAEYYRTNVLVLLTQRQDIATELTKYTGDHWLAEYNRARTNVLIGAACIGLLLLATIYAGYRQTKAVSQPLNQLVNTLERMRSGDFSQRLNLKRKDEFGFLSDSLNRLADDLSILVGQVQRSGIQVNMTATEIAATAKEQQSTSTEIAATTAEIGATSKQISATSKELDKTMHEVGQVAEDTTQLANRGQSGIARMENTMRQIMESTSAVTAKLAVLNEKMSNIATVVTTITKVADQTNLLSLNAAIEAEKAGEYGLGFAVVALEIRRLADQTAVATYDIEKMVKEMQSAVAAGVMGMDKFSEDVRRGAEENRQVSAQLAQIIHQVQTLTPRFATVSEGMHAQATGAQQISETLTQLSEAAHQSADTLRQSNLAIDQLNEAARGLQTSVARFKLESKS